MRFSNSASGLFKSLIQNRSARPRAAQASDIAPDPANGSSRRRNFVGRCGKISGASVRLLP